MRRHMRRPRRSRYYYRPLWRNYLYNWNYPLWNNYWWNPYPIKTDKIVETNSKYNMLILLIGIIIMLIIISFILYFKL